MSPVSKTAARGTTAASTPANPAPATAEMLDADPDILEHPGADTVTIHTVPPHHRLDEIPAKMARVREIADVIRVDMAGDVERLDGAPLNGRTVAEIHADLAAAIVGLSNCVTALAEVLSS